MKRLAATALLVAFVGACSDAPDAPATSAQQEPSDPQYAARSEIRDAFKAAQRAPVHASDGGGRAWLDLPPGSDGSVVAGTTGRWTIQYEAGPLGVAVGGAVYLQVSPFWEWSTPQVEDEQREGFTRVTSSAEGVALAPLVVGQQLLCVTIGGRALRSGERITFEYGAGPLGARADAYAESNSRFWIAVDGDGGAGPDGQMVRKLLEDSPGVDVLPGPPAMLVATLTSTAQPGQPVKLVVALLDARANAVGACEAKLELLEAPAEFGLPREIALTALDRGRKTLAAVAGPEGVARVRVRATVGASIFEARSNPLLVAAVGPRVLWADIHGHSALSDGTGQPEEWWRFARDVAALDVAALTDHDHWGLLFLDEHPGMWQRLVDVARSFDAPGTFVALPAYEWTSWLSGHRHVLFFGEATPLVSSLDERYETPEQLRAALRGLDALVIPHHPAGGPIAIDWRVAPDPELEPLVEVCSVHGSSEAFDCPRILHAPQPGHFARDALERGYRLGFVGGGDGHDAHPGLEWKGPHYPTGGLAAILSEELTRAGVLDALKARRCYATSGPRILLRFALAGARMGEVLPAARVARDPTLFVQVIGTAPLETIEVVMRGGRLLTLPCRGEMEFAASASVGVLGGGDWVYVRVVQQDGGMAWSSPIFVE